MLCKYCSNIDIAECRSKEGYQHHRNYTDMCKARDQGCKLCYLIASKFDDWAANMDRIANQLPDSGFYSERAKESRITLMIDPDWRATVGEHFNFMTLKDYGGFAITFDTIEGMSNWQSS
jgi:hypothetical protein